MNHDFILLDRSGSMLDSGKWPEAIMAIDTYIKRLVETNVDTGVTLVCFDKEHAKLDFRILRDRVVPRTWRKVEIDEVSPRGFTPLNDAIGEIISLADKGGYSKVSLTIITDGQENASTELSHEAAKKLMEARKAKGWDINFVGAQFKEVFTQSAGYGVGARNTVAASAGNMQAAMGFMASTRGAFYDTGATADWSAVQDKLADEDLSDEEKLKISKGQAA